MFQFARFTSAAYGFSDRGRRITAAGFSHSEIRGSKAVQRLTAAYRSRPRPSSTPGAKASTVNSYYLDFERSPPTRGLNRFKSITHRNHVAWWLGRVWGRDEGPPR